MSATLAPNPTPSQSASFGPSLKGLPTKRRLEVSLWKPNCRGWRAATKSVFRLV
jgi:hypothetical protein